MARRRVEIEEREDEATEQGGWLFADSFLALMIIFLATISFVPDVKNVADATGQYSESLSLAYSQYDPAAIEKDLSSFISEKALPGGSKVVFARIIGGAPENSQKEDNGYMLALKYSIQLQRDEVSKFKDTRFDLSSSTMVEDGTVVMVLTFSP